MPYIDVSSDQPISLEPLGFPSIMIKEVRVLGDNYRDLFHPIKISTKFPDGRFYQSLFHPSGYWSNTKRDNNTDLPIDVEIHYCAFTELQIHSPEKLVHLRLIYDPVIKNKLIVKVNKDLDGYTFSLPEDSAEVIISRNKLAKPIRSIFVSYDIKEDFETLVGRLRDYILPALTGLSQDELSKIKVKSFIDASNNKEIKSF